MFRFFRQFQNTWYDYGFEIVLVGTIIIILILALFRYGKKGTWTSKDHFVYLSKAVYGSPHKLSKEPQSLRRRPPTESKGEKECKRVLGKSG